MKISSATAKKYKRILKKQLSRLNEAEKERLCLILSGPRGIVVEETDDLLGRTALILSLALLSTPYAEDNHEEINYIITISEGMAATIRKSLKLSPIDAVKIMTIGELIREVTSGNITDDCKMSFYFFNDEPEPDIDRELWYVNNKFINPKTFLFITREFPENRRLLSLFGGLLPLEKNQRNHKNVFYYTFFNELEGNIVGVDKNELQAKSDALKEAIQDVVDKIRKNEDPDQMNMYRKIFKQHVPLSMRHYFAAWLMKEYLDRDGKKKKWGKTLFISVGKNRKVYPKDLISLFTMTGEVNKEDIGDIKIMDSYSFLNINPSLADQAISKLDGIDYRGRKLTVNFARKSN